MMVDRTKMLEMSWIVTVLIWGPIIAATSPLKGCSSTIIDQESHQFPRTFQLEFDARSRGNLDRGCLVCMKASNSSAGPVGDKHPFKKPAKLPMAINFHLSIGQADSLSLFAVMCLSRYARANSSERKIVFYDKNLRSSTHFPDQKSTMMLIATSSCQW